MRLFQINICPDLSTGTLMNSIANFVVSKGGECYTASPPKNVEKFWMHYSIGSMLSRYIHIYIGTKLGLEASFSLIPTIKLLMKIHKFSPDVLHLHNIHGYFINLSLLFLYIKHTNLKVVWTVHDCWTFTGICHHYTKLNCKKWMSQCKNCEYYTQNKRILFDLSKYEFNRKKRLYSSSENITFIGPSKWLADEMKKSFLGEDSVNYIYNGINLSEFKYTANNFKETYDMEDKFLIVGLASHWTKNKGLNDFIELSEKLDSSYSIILIGLSVGQLELLKDSKITGVGRLNSHVEISKWLSAADLFINASTEETFGLVNVEAMACGTPVIGYDTTATPEIVNNDVGAVVKANDIGEVIDKIELIRKRGKGFYTEKCKSRVNELFSVNKTVVSYYDLYKSTLEVQYD